MPVPCAAPLPGPYQSQNRVVCRGSAPIICSRCRCVPGVPGHVAEPFAPVGGPEKVILSITATYGRAQLAAGSPAEQHQSATERALLVLRDVEPTLCLLA